MNIHKLESLYKGHGDGSSRLTELAKLLSNYNYFIEKASEIPAPRRHYCD